MEKLVCNLLTQYYGDETFQIVRMIKDEFNRPDKKQICQFKDENGADRVLKIYGQDNSTRMKKIYGRIEKQEFYTLPEIIDVGDWEEGCFVIEEFIRGQNLNARIRECKDDIFFIIRTIKELCDAVKPLHKEIKPAIIHCDISPNNIVIDADTKEVRLFDLDMSYEEGSREKWKRGGTPGFCAPDMMNAIPCIESDVYSIGAVLKYWLEATDMYDSLDTKSVECLKGIIEKTQESNSSNRYRNTDELKNALAEAEILAFLYKTIEKLDVFRSDPDFRVFAYTRESSDKLERLSKIIKANLGRKESDQIEALYAVTDQNGGKLVFTRDAVYSIRKIRRMEKFGVPREIRRKWRKKYLVSMLRYF